MDDTINAFTAQARRYCAFIEDIPAPNSWTFAQGCLTELLGLYQLALHLPEVAPGNRGSLERINHETWAAVRENLGRQLARDYYWAIFEPLELEKPEPICGSLSDDLADIWRDLKPGVAAIDTGTTTLISDVVWHWRFSFETHWGHHAANAITALHAVSFGAFADEGRPATRPQGE